MKKIKKMDYIVKTVCICSAILLSACSSKERNADTETQSNPINEESGKNEAPLALAKENANLDLTYMTVDEFVPDTGSWKVLTYSDLRAGEYGRSISGDIIEEWSSKGYSQDAVRDGSHISRYFDGDVYAELYTGGQMSFCRPGKIADLLGYSDPYYGDLRLLGKTVHEYDLSSNSDRLNEKYMIGNKEESIGEALLRMNEYIENNKLCKYGLGDIEYTIDKVRVFSLPGKDDSFGYVFDYGLMYEGVPIFCKSDKLGVHSAVELQKNDGKKKRIFGSDHFGIGTCSEDGVEYMWTPIPVGTTPTVKEIDKIISLDEALKIASDYLANNHVFTVGNVQLLYAITCGERYTPDYTITVEPIWRIAVTDLDTAKYSIMYLNISAYDGYIMIEVG